MRSNTLKVFIFAEQLSYISNFIKLQNENETAYTSRNEHYFLIIHRIMDTLYGIIRKHFSIAKCRKSHVKATFTSIHSEYFTMSYLR